jgi:hypothetical protein
VAGAYIPTGWPTGVHPPGAEGFEQTAVNWLLDVVPPDYRLHGVLLRHPVALASLARHHLAACIEGARQGYRGVRAEFGRDLPPSSVAAILAVYQTEGRRLVATAKAAELVDRALRGEQFVPQIGGSQDDRRVTGLRPGNADAARGRGTPAARSTQRASAPRERAS